MEILNSLREKTRILHEEIEKDNIAGKIMDHSISLDEYKLLLFQNYVAYKSSESEIARFLPDYSMDKTLRLEKDLKNLGVTDLDLELDFNCDTVAEAIGAAYVVEGSAMGGMLIGKEIRNCDTLKSVGDQYFFSGDRSSMAGWNQFLKYLRSRDFNSEEISAATKKAKQTFLLFKEAFNLELTNC
ncbi:biliverdin-producing heme oxygenase [Christiangramia sp. SM2212]|uniref:Biliverdin-producing heme oxygenase n=1 Tax=Christiangramia sediminicola TaxID=3073267 RepID=A0ABU1ER82_9FLAO|nr:biliverdin-producing heme oxygenase [Christiangramia sp. SM2212]MDR5590537.1 biliverdin-producing heme oxygenase [Christiangramia sp. SM2212]